jgi:hypothetical protein
MKTTKLTLLAGALTVLPLTGIAYAQHSGQHHPVATLNGNTVTADLALTGVPMRMSPDQLPDQFSTQLRDDVSKATGTAILKQNGKDIEYTFKWENLSGPVTQAHFHYGPHNAVGARAFSVCGVQGESPACPTGTNDTISGVWKNADINAIDDGGIIIAFHTAKYPAPIGEVAVYIPAASSSKTASLEPASSH